MKIIIVGTGLSGLMGACQIAGPLSQWDSGNKKIEVEIIGDGSGASPYVHGFNIPLHKNDSIEAFTEDTMNSGYHLSRKELVRTLCKDSVLLLKDLETMGISLEKKDGEYVLLKPLGSSWPRVTGSGNHTGAEIMAVLRRYLKECEEVTFTEHARVLRLDVRKNRVCGVILWNKETEWMEYRRADAVLLASGGFCGIYPFSTNSTDIGGDGIAMAYEAGLPLTDMEFIQFEPSVALYPEKVRGKGMITTMFYEGAVLRNGKMERFMKTGKKDGPGECVGKDVLAKAIYKEMTHGTPTEHGGVYFDATGVGREKLKKSYPAYMERYEQAGMDISRESFEIAPGPHTSLGGICITPDGSTEIHGIFAAGEITGGIHGANRVGGNAGLETLVYGKRAGKSICTYLDAMKEVKAVTFDIQAQKLLDWANQTDGTPISEETIKVYRTSMQEILQNDLYIERNGNDLAKAIRQLDAMQKEVRQSACREAPFEKIRLENDLICASLLAHSAYTRTESTGCHMRTDSTSDPYPYHIILKKWKDGLKIIKERVEEQN